jgi:acyl dehydratase
VYRLRPERPADEPPAKSGVLAVTPSKSRPKRLIKVRTTTLNQNGEAVLVQVSNLIVPRRDR